MEGPSVSRNSGAEQSRLKNPYGRCGEGLTGEIQESCSYATRNMSETEQWISMGAGAALLAAGLVRGKASGLLLSLVGGALVHRGLTAHCYGYELMGIDTSEPFSAAPLPARAGSHSWYSD